MKTQHIARGVVAVASVGFAGVALAIWVAPNETAHFLGLDFVRRAGAAVMRADVGGLFAGMAALCAMAASTARPSWSLAAVAVLTSIVIGRVLGWFGAGRIGRDVVELVVEIGCITALLALAKSAAPRAVAVPRQRTWASSALLPEQAAGIANEAQVSLLVFYHLLPAPDGALARRVFGNGVDEVRRGRWTIADDGNLFTLPIGTTQVQVGTVVGSGN